MKFATVVLAVALTSSLANAQCTGSYEPTGNALSWSVEWTARDDNTIEFNVSAQTTGWVGIGFSENNLMTDSDVVIGAANTDNSMSYVSDRWVGGSRTFPSVDANQDLTMTMAEEVNGWTTVSFTRARTTGDPSPTDVSLENAVFLLWASGDEQNFNADQPESIIYHGSNRGVSDQEISICADSTDSGAGIASVAGGSMSILIISAMMSSVLASIILRL